MFQVNRFKLVQVSFLSALLIVVLAACSVSTQKESNGDDKKVDIKTPFAEIHVGSDTSAQDAGIATYPGARPKQEANDKHRANVQIGGEDFGLKVVAATYVTDDPPQKVIDFYRNDLKKYGKVLECPKGLNENHDKNGGELRCDDKGSEEPGKLDLAVGVPERQHIVAVKPNGKGTEFNTVFVQVKGGKANQTM
jgi:hypothetical protein